MQKFLRQTRDAWPNLDFYQRFEQTVAITLSILVSIIIILATWNLVVKVYTFAFEGLIDPAELQTFQSMFGMIMTVLIALEFNHTILSLVERGRSIIQLRTVVLIALLAVLRKFIIIDVATIDAFVLLGLSASVIALGWVYWTLREKDQSSDAARGS